MPTERPITEWTVDETIDWMLAEQQASEGLSVIQGSVFKAQAYACATLGFKPYWKTLESVWKEKTNNAPLPGKYRSSKSVIKQALDLGISIIDKGKTEIEKEIKAVRAESAKALGEMDASRPGGTSAPPVSVPLVTEDDWYAHIAMKLAEAYHALGRDAYLRLIERVKEAM